jgi:TorA maturation chaperone TorD
MRCAREYFDLFVGLGQGRLMPYASHYLTGSLYGRPLASLRETLGGLGVEWTGPCEPEDHVSILCEGGSDRRRDRRSAWRRSRVRRKLPRAMGEAAFVDLEHAKSVQFYACVGLVGRAFMGIESESYALSA